MEFARVRIFASRDGDRVTGHVELPYEVCGRLEVPIDYRSRRPDPDTASPQCSSDDNRRGRRLDLIKQWRRLCRDQPGTSEAAHARQLGVSVRPLQLWERRLAIEGPEGLRDRYTRPAGRVLTLSVNDARNALLLCAWWSFRIGNVARIDTGMMHCAAGLICGTGIPVADVLATIDAYYGARIDRRKYPFKRFSKWCKYPEGFQRWLYIACDQEDYRNSARRLRAAEVAYLKATGTRRIPMVVDAQTRRRQTVNYPTRSAIRSLAMDSLPSDVTHQLNRPGGPGTIGEAIWLLPDNCRMMLLSASAGDRDARSQARLTMPVWWPMMPERIRTAIDEYIAAERSARSASRHPMTDDQAATRRLEIILPQIRDRAAKDARHLHVAARFAL